MTRVGRSIINTRDAVIFLAQEGFDEHRGICALYTFSVPKFELVAYSITDVNREGTENIRTQEVIMDKYMT